MQKSTKDTKAPRHKAFLMANFLAKLVVLA
jgi:hypothetical protein